MIGIGAIVSSIVLAFIFAKKIIDPLNNTKDMIRDIAEGEGDLTKRLDIVTDDEIGQLSRSFNGFAENLQEKNQDLMR